MGDVDNEYLERRRQKCLASAATALDPDIAQVYRQLAAQYARVLESAPFFASLDARYAALRHRK